MEKFENLELELKELILDTLNLSDFTVEDIDSEEALFGEGLGLDSIDALELGIAVKKKFDLKLNVEENLKDHFYSINTLAKFIQNMNQSEGANVGK